MRQFLTFVCKTASSPALRTDTPALVLPLHTWWWHTPPSEMAPFASFLFLQILIYSCNLGDVSWFVCFFFQFYVAFPFILVIKKYYYNAYFGTSSLIHWHFCFCSQLASQRPPKDTDRARCLQPYSFPGESASLSQKEDSGSPGQTRPHSPIPIQAVWFCTNLSLYSTDFQLNPGVHLFYNCHHCVYSRHITELLLSCSFMHINRKLELFLYSLNYLYSSISNILLVNNK